MKIAIGCDHIVTPIKDEVKAWLESLGHKVIDCGTYDKVRTHFPIYGRRIGLNVARGDADFGVAICGTGVGITNSAQKVKGVRATLVRDVLAAKQARQELDANVVGIGGRITGLGLIQEIVTAFINTKYESTMERDETIKLIDSQIKTLNDDEDLLDKQIAKWEKGDYTEGEPQAKITAGRSC